MDGKTLRTDILVIGSPTRMMVWCASPQSDMPKGPRRAPTVFDGSQAIHLTRPRGSAF